MAGIISNEQRITLDLLPDEILKNIVSIAQVRNLTQLLSDGAFTQLNQNLRHAINHEVEKKSCYKYSNRATLSRLNIKSCSFWAQAQRVMDLWKSFQNIDFNTCESFLLFYKYCAEEKLRISFKVAYQMETIIDCLEFEKVVSKLEHSNNIKLALDLDYNKLGCVDGSQILTNLSNVKGCATELSIVGLDNIELDVEAKTLNGVTLKLGGCRFSGSLTKCSNLIELSLYCQIFDITQLPQSLKHLYLYDCRIYVSNRDKSNDNVPILKHLTFHHYDEYIYDQFEDEEEHHGGIHMIEEALRALISTETISIDFMADGEWDSDEWFVEMLRNIVEEKGLKLESLSLNGRFEDPLICSSNSFKFKIAYGPYYESNYPPCPELASTLETLSLSGPKLKMSDLSKIDPYVLKHLHLEGYFHDEMIDFKGFKNLKYLHLGETELIDEISLPDSLEVLILTNHRLNSIDKVTFPKNLTALQFNVYDIESLDDLIFPPALAELHLQNSRIKHLQGEVFPSTLKRLIVRVTDTVDLSKDMYGKLLQLEKLWLGSPERNELTCTLPTSLQSLHLNLLGPSVFNELGNDLVHLTINYCRLDLRGLKFGSDSKLKYFSMSCCNIKTLDMNLPQSLVGISLSDNDFLEVPPQLGHLENLRVLKFNDRMKIFKIEFLHNSLEVLDLSHNSIDELQLKFPDDDTKLKQLNLRSTGLKNITMESIGHGDKSKHSSLLSINLSDNKMLTENQILALIPNLPKSVHELRVYKESHEKNVNYLSMK